MIYNLIFTSSSPSEILLMFSCTQVEDLERKTTPSFWATKHMKIRTVSPL